MSESASGCRREVPKAQSREALEDEEKHDGDERSEEIEGIEKIEKKEKTDDADPIDRSNPEPEPERVESDLSQKPTESEENLDLETETGMEKRDPIPKDNNEPGENTPVHQSDKLDLVEDIDEENPDNAEELLRKDPIEEGLVEYVDDPKRRRERDSNTIDDAEILADSAQIEDSWEMVPDSEIEQNGEQDSEQDSSLEEIPSNFVLYNFIYANNIPWETEDSEDETDGDEDSDLEETCELPLPDPIPEVTETTSDPLETSPTDQVVEFIQSDKSHWSNLAPKETPPKTSPLKSENQDTSVMTSPEQIPSEADAKTDSPSDQNLRSDLKGEILDINKSDLLPTMPSPDTLLKISQHREFDEDMLETMGDFFTKVRFGQSIFRWKEETIASKPIPKFLAHCQAVRDETIHSDMVMIKKGYVFYAEGYVRCSSLQVKFLFLGSMKAKLLPMLRKANYFTHFSADSKPLSQGGKIPDVLLALPKSAKALHEVWKMNEPPKGNADAHDQWTTSKPGHQAVERYLYQQMPQALAIETPIWDERLQITGHIDLLIQDGKTLYVVDYKPEADRDHEYRFIKTLPQVSMYGKLMQKMVPNDIQVKCVSFSQDHAWVYDPRSMRETLVAAILPYAINKEAVKENTWIPISQDQRAPMAKLPQGRVNHYFQKILETPSTSSYMRNYRRILYQLQAGKDLIEKDAEFIQKGIQKKFNLSQSYLGVKMDDFLLEYQKKFQEPELRDHFFASIIAGMPLSESMDKYLQSKFAHLSRGGLMTYFARFRAFSRNILQDNPIDRIKLDPFLREIYDRAAKTDIEKLRLLDAKWKERTTKQDKIPIGKYPSIVNLVQEQMGLGKNLTDIKKEILSHSPKTEHEARISYFCKLVRQNLQSDRKKAQQMYNVPPSWHRLKIATHSEDSVKVVEAISPYHLEKQLEGLSSIKYYEQLLAQNLSIDQIKEQIFALIAPEQREQRFNSFLHTLHDWTKIHREYLFEHFRISQDVPYQIKVLDNFKISVELRLAGFCQQRLTQGIPIEQFAQEGLDQCPPDRQRIKWRQMCNIINKYARENPQKFEKAYKIPVNTQFSAAKYLTGRVTLKFKKQSRKFEPAFKYIFEHGSLKDQVLVSLSDNPSMELQPFFRSLVGRYPSKKKEIRTAFRRHVNLWIKTHPDHPQQEHLKQRLVRMYMELQAGTIRALSNKDMLAIQRRESNIEQFMQNNQDYPQQEILKKTLRLIDIESENITTQVQLCVDLLANRPVEPSMEQFMQTYREKRGKPAQLGTAITYVSRLRRLIKYKVHNPKCTQGDLWNQSGMGNQELSFFIKEVIKDIPLENLKSLSLMKSEPTPRGLFFIELLQNSPLKRCIKRYQTCALESSDQELLKVNLNEDVKQFQNLIQFRLSNPKCSVETIKGHFKDSLPNFAQERVFQMAPDILSEFHVNRISAIATNDAVLIDRYLHEKYFTPKISAESTAEVHQKIHQFYNFLHTRFPALDSIRSVTIPHFNTYVTHISEEKHITGYPLRDYQAHIHRFLAHFLPEFGQYSSTTGIAETTQIPIDQAHLDQFLQDQYIIPGKSKDSLTTAKRAITDYYCFLQQDFPDVRSVTVMDNYELASFVKFLTTHKQLSEGTVKNKVGYVKRYLAQLP